MACAVYADHDPRGELADGPSHSPWPPARRPRPHPRRARRPPPARRIAQGNFHVLADLTKMDLPYANNGVAARRDNLAPEADFLERFMRAYVEGIHYFKTHPGEGARSVTEWVKVDDPEYARTAWEFYAQQLPRVPVPAPGAMQAVLDSLVDDQPATRTATPDQVLDLSLVRQLEASGFIDRLYAGAP